MMMTDASIFVDTNVLLRALHKELPDHQKCSQIILTAINQRVPLWISRQANTSYKSLDLDYLYSHFLLMRHLKKYGA